MGAAPGELERDVVPESGGRRTGDQDGPAGLVADLVGRPGHGRDREEVEQPTAELDVAVDAHRALRWRTSPAGEDSEGLPVGRHGDGRLVGEGGQPAAAPLLVDAVGDGLVTDDVEADRRAGRGSRSLREHVAQALGEVVDGVRGGRGVEPAGTADCAAYVLLVHPQVEGSVAQQGLPVPADATEDPVRLRRAVGRRVCQQGRVPLGRRLADLVDQLVGGAVAARTTPCSV